MGERPALQDTILALSYHICLSDVVLLFLGTHRPTWPTVRDCLYYRKDLENYLTYNTTTTYTKVEEIELCECRQMNTTSEIGL